MHRPGPRSKTRGKKVLNPASLGDSTSSENENPDRSPPAGRVSTRSARRMTPVRNRSSDSDFRTPERATGVTDYDIEFTTRYIANPSPAKCSTLVPGSSQEESSQTDRRTRNKSPTKIPVSQRAAKEQETTNRGKGKQIASLGRGQQSQESDSDDGNEDSDDQNGDDDNETPKQTERRTRNNSPTKIPASQKAAKKQEATKKNASIGKERQAGNRGRQQQTDESGSDDDGDDESQDKENSGQRRKEQRNPSGYLTEDNRPSVSHAKKANPSERRTPAAPAAKTQTVKPSTSKSAAQRQKTAAPVKKPRKQLNPQQKDKRFWREVKMLQHCTTSLIPRLPFSRLIREIMRQASAYVTQITPTALGALQESSEMYLTQILQDAYMLTLHRGRVTLSPRDLELLNYLRPSM